MQLLGSTHTGTLGGNTLDSIFMYMYVCMYICTVIILFISNATLVFVGEAHTQEFLGETPCISTHMYMYIHRVIILHISTATLGAESCEFFCSLARFSS
jgi:hypothetical protein